MEEQNKETEVIEEVQTNEWVESIAVIIVLALVMVIFCALFIKVIV